MRSRSKLGFEDEIRRKAGIFRGQWPETLGKLEEAEGYLVYPRSIALHLSLVNPQYVQREDLGEDGARFDVVFRVGGLGIA